MFRAFGLSTLLSLSIAETWPAPSEVLVPGGIAAFNGDSVYVLAFDGTQAWSFNASGNIEAHAVANDKLLVASTPYHIDGWSNETFPLTLSCLHAGDVEWSFTLNGTCSHPTACSHPYLLSDTDGNVFIRVNDAKSNTQNLHAVDMDGGLKWTSRVGSVALPGGNCQTGKMLYVAGDDGQSFHALLASDGSEVWSVGILSNPYTPQIPFHQDWHVGRDGEIYVVASAYTQQPFFLAFSEEGALLWNKTLPVKPSQFAPHLSVGRDGTIYMSYTDNGTDHDNILVALSKDGAEKWKHVSPYGLYMSQIPSEQNANGDVLILVTPRADKYAEEIQIMTLHPDGSNETFRTFNGSDSGCTWAAATPSRWLSSWTEPVWSKDGTVFVHGRDNHGQRGCFLAIANDGSEFRIFAKMRKHWGQIISDSLVVGDDGTAYFGPFSHLDERDVLVALGNGTMKWEYVFSRPHLTATLI